MAFQRTSVTLTFFPPIKSSDSLVGSEGLRVIIMFCVLICVLHNGKSPDRPVVKLSSITINQEVTNGVSDPRPDKIYIMFSSFPCHGVGALEKKKNTICFMDKVNMCALHNGQKKNNSLGCLFTLFIQCVASKMLFFLFFTAF